jgi:hypothetical protein
VGERRGKRGEGGRGRVGGEREREREKGGWKEGEEIEERGEGGREKREGEREREREEREKGGGSGSAD